MNVVFKSLLAFVVAIPAWAQSPVDERELGQALDYLVSHRTRVYQPTTAEALASVGTFVTGAGLLVFVGTAAAMHIVPKVAAKHVSYEWAMGFDILTPPLLMLSFLGTSASGLVTTIAYGIKEGQLNADPHARRRHDLADVLGRSRGQALAQLREDPAGAALVVELARTIREQDAILGDQALPRRQR